VSLFFGGFRGDVRRLAVFGEVVVEIVYQRVAGIDVHKRQVTVAVRVQGPDGARVQRVRQFPTFWSGLQEMAAWLVDNGVTHAAMEATGIYWRPVWHALAGEDSITVLVCNAAHVKNVPGRKTDVADAAWLAQLLEVGLLRGSFTPPEQIVAIRDLTRYRRSLVAERTREIQRLSKALEDAGVKIDSVASSTLGVSTRAMVESMISGERDPAGLAQHAKGRMRAKIPDLERAVAARFGAHHAMMCRLHLDHIDHLDAAIATVEERIESMLVPFQVPRDRLRTIPGIAAHASAAIIAEIGPDVAAFPSARHFASWIGLCPGSHESAGRRKSGRARKGNKHLRTVFVEAAWAASRTRGRLQARFNRLARRFGGIRNPDARKKAAYALAHTLAEITWHVLHDERDYTDLGADFYTRQEDPERRRARLVSQLNALGYNVDLTPAA
jgi:transposase